MNDGNKTFSYQSTEDDKTLETVESSEVITRLLQRISSLEYEACIREVQMKNLMNKYRNNI